jgi:phosphoserine phosphatase RsbU/P
MEQSIVRQIPIFASLSQQEVVRLANLLQAVHFSPGALILREGDAGGSFYFILEGEVEAIKAMGTSEERKLGVSKAGDFLGEMGLLNPSGLRTVSIRAVTPVMLLEMENADFEMLLRQFPRIAQDLLRVMSLRLREANEMTVRDLRDKNRELAQAYLDLMQAQEQIIEKEKIERELQLARDIVEQYLPHNIPSLAGFEFGANMLPARAVGGDFYDFIPLDDDRIGIVVGDVSDKGLPAALLMALTRSILRAEACTEASPGETLISINQHLSEMNDLGMFVTVLYGVLDTRTGEFAYARAGHEVPLFFDGEGKSISLAYEQGQPLGLFIHPYIDEKAITIFPGYTLLIFSDGLPDSMNAQGEFFGPERLVQASLPDRQISAQELSNRVIATIKAFQGSNAQFDDMTLVVLQRKNLEPGYEGETTDQTCA